MSDKHNWRHVKIQKQLVFFSLSYFNKLYWQSGESFVVVAPIALHLILFTTNELQQVHNQSVMEAQFVNKKQALVCL